MSDSNALRSSVANELSLRPANLLNWKGSDITVGTAINREINHAIRHYESSRFRWNEIRNFQMGVTVNGTRTYSLPPDFIKMDTLKVEYANAFITVHPRVWDDIEERDRQITGSLGIPFEFTIYGNVLRLYPVPNQALSLVASYLSRVGIPTSLTGSYCAITTMGGGSLTVTSTTSHNNRLDGWTTDGEELIRARAVASVEINYLKSKDTISEMRLLLNNREPYLSIRERLAYERLADEAQDAQAAGIIRPYVI